VCVCVRVRVCALNKEEEDDFFPFKSLLFFFSFFPLSLDHVFGRFVCPHSLYRYTHARSLARCSSSSSYYIYN
jgi:hypothetical protein